MNPRRCNYTQAEYNELMKTIKQQSSEYVGKEAIRESDKPGSAGVSARKSCDGKEPNGDENDEKMKSYTFENEKLTERENDNTLQAKGSTDEDMEGSQQKPNKGIKGCRIKWWKK